MRDASKQIDQALEELAAALEQGQSETLRRYLAVMGRFHRYSLGNMLLIAMQRPDATHVAGFRAWKKLGRHVKAGEHGIAIIAPIVRTHRRNQDENEEETRDVIAFKSAFVFDVSQTAGEPLPEFSKVTGDPAEQLDRLQEFVRAQGITLTFADNLHGAILGLSAGGKIILLSGMTPAEAYAALAHELGHEMLHWNAAADIPHRVRELEAEAVAYVVCQASGLDGGTAARDYVLLHQGSSQLLMASLERIRQTSAAIINGLQDAEPRESAQGREPQREEMPTAQASAPDAAHCRLQAA